MTTASHVPETRGTLGDGPVATLSSARPWKILRDAFVRFRYADGFSFARSMAFQMVLTLIPGVVVVVATTALFGGSTLRSLLREATITVAPGPAGEILLRAFEQGTTAVRQERMIAMLLGGAVALISGATAMSQLQRGASRIYGIVGDRTTIRRYGLATGLAVTAGTLLAVGFVTVVLGSNVSGALSLDVADLWAWGRWPVGVVALTIGLAALFKVAPYRIQPEFSWLAVGGGISVAALLVVSTGLSFYLNASTAFGEIYGPLAGFIGVMLWAQLSSIAIFYGLGIAAQMEAERAGVEGPTVEATIPESTDDRREGTTIHLRVPESVDVVERHEPVDHGPGGEL